MSKFGRNASGNVALTFGLALSALVPVFAIGLTYSDAARVRGKMQKSIDAGALARISHN
jgi:Flp pilus assembly protein TadG